ncbi:hypothetical protein KJ590_04635 [Patescibacteria group bacterium]|nr:hypothetical protein [Patescibacteria group bacterium]
MIANTEEVLIPTLVGVGGWFVKNFLFGLFQKRNQLKRVEWEYRLKEIYCPLYFWSGLLVMQMDRQVHASVCEHLQEVLAKAAYVLPKDHYYTLIKLLEVAHNQETSGVPDTQRDSLRSYLYGQIEVLNFILYRSQETGGVGDISATLSPYRSLLRLFFIGATHLLVWGLIALIIYGLLWLYQARQFSVIGVCAVVLLIVFWVDVRRRDDIEQGIENRLKSKG